MGKVMNRMIRLGTGLILGSCLAVSAAAAEPDMTEAKMAQLEQEAQAITQEFGKQLQSTLQASMMAGGPLQAINVCRSTAPAIAQRLSEHKGWNVARTSHKVRNPDNAADPWEQQIIAQWQDKIARGAPLANMKASAVMAVNGVPTYRYMSAIPTGEVCLTCHGTRISGQVQAALKDLYPADQATGFSKGELRGAFTLMKTLE